MDMRSKARTLSGPVSDPAKLPRWNYDGSSTGQAAGEDSEVILYPQVIFRDPFRRGNHHLLVMCDAYTPAGDPIPTNKRHAAANIFGQIEAEEPLFGIEQEYTLLWKDSNRPLGWPLGGYPGPQGPYYCGIGADKAFGREIVDAHYNACLYAGVNISGINAEVMPGYELIKKAIHKLQLRHADHIAAYGEGNERRLTGGHETAEINTFSWGVADRGASIRVGRKTEKEGRGYFEDRRPSSNMDPYVVTSMIAHTTLLWEQP
ncbi:unnamed protein product [Linum tenue]|uniref:glutamine synthetase n=1 Tax=Linum tenue TaxID=586396 RepID=A0AAV0MU43_9ROSI|nr:unnamed protein product [Linum tenue]